MYVYALIQPHAHVRGHMGMRFPYLLPGLEEPPEDWHQTGGWHVSVPFQPNGTLSVLTWGPQVQLRGMSLAHLEVSGWFSPRFFLGLANGLPDKLMLID